MQIRAIIDDNCEMNVEKHGDSSYSQDIIDEIFEKINTCNSVLDLKQRIIKRTSYVIGLFTNKQPFSDFNRHSAYAAGMQFLRRNNLNLEIRTSQEEQIIFELLDKTKRKKDDDPTICTEIEVYLKSRVMLYRTKEY